MESFTDPGARRASVMALLRQWNRKAHYYIGLFLLFFVWLFFLTGLLLNHSQWKFAEFWENRLQGSYEKGIVTPVAGGDLAQARDLMRQLGIRGEIEWTASRPDSSRLDFRVSRPGHFDEIRADFTRSKAQVRTTDLNGWGIARILHTFTGVRSEDSRNSRDWMLTTLWAWTMDAVGGGLILMVFSSYWIWIDSARNRLSGAAALGLGAFACALFCLGLAWLY